MRLYLLFQEGQKAAQRHCIPEMGLTHALNLHLQTTATTQYHELSLDFMNEKQKPKYQKPCTCRPLVLHAIWGCHWGHETTHPVLNITGQLLSDSSSHFSHVHESSARQSEERLHCVLRSACCPGMSAHHGTTATAKHKP